MQSTISGITEIFERASFQKSSDNNSGNSIKFLHTINTRGRVFPLFCVVTFGRNPEESGLPVTAEFILRDLGAPTITTKDQRVSFEMVKELGQLDGFCFDSLSKAYDMAAEIAMKSKLEPEPEEEPVLTSDQISARLNEVEEDFMKLTAERKRLFSELKKAYLREHEDFKSPIFKPQQAVNIGEALTKVVKIENPATNEKAIVNAPLNPLAHEQSK